LLQNGLNSLRKRGVMAVSVKASGGRAASRGLGPDILGRGRQNGVGDDIGWEKYPGALRVIDGSRTGSAGGAKQVRKRGFTGK